MPEEKKKSWFAENIWKVVITFFCSSILTSIMGVGGSYFTGLFTSPGEIKRLKAQDVKDSIHHRKQDSAIAMLTTWANQDYDTLTFITKELRSHKKR